MRLRYVTTLLVALTASHALADAPKAFDPADYPGAVPITATPFEFRMPQQGAAASGLAGPPAMAINRAREEVRQ